MGRLQPLLARALGFAVSNALAHAAIETQAATDELTGCLDRRAGLDGVAQAMRVATHGGPAVGAMMIDLDHFKLINDRHGRRVGDDVLRGVGAAIAAGLRGSDIVMRYGGEEFLVAIADVDERALTASAERVRGRIDALTVANGSGSRGSVTTSVGIALSTSADGLESLIARADGALYAAKAAGRDRVVFRPPPDGDYQRSGRSVGPTMWLSPCGSCSCATSWLKCGDVPDDDVGADDRLVVDEAVELCARVSVATALSSSWPLR